MSYALGQNYQLRYSLALALFIHGLLIFAITIETINATQSANREMEVTLAVQAASEKPDDAQFLAAQNQQASGDSEDSRQPETLQEALLHHEQVQQVEPLVIPEQQSATIEPHNQRIITTIAVADWAVAPVDETADPDPAAEFDPENMSLSELSVAIASLEARLSNQLQPNARKPRTLRITSTSALASDDADYVRQWRDRVETIGNLYYPEEAKKEQLYGDVRLLVTVLASGVVEQIEIKASSGQPVLDKAAIESIHLASPFEPFPAGLAASYDKIEVIRTWQFRKNRVSANSY